MSSRRPLSVLGIRREDRGRWERRAPLAPQHVKELVAKGIKVIVQPSSLRTFSDRIYAEVWVHECARFDSDITTSTFVVLFSHVVYLCICFECYSLFSVRSPTFTYVPCGCSCACSQLRCSAGVCACMLVAFFTNVCCRQEQ